MKKYEDPKLNVEVMELEDIITSSNSESTCEEECPAYNCPYDLGWQSVM